MKIYATRNTLAAAVAFTVLSGIAGIGNANLSEISVESIRVSYADLNLNRADEAETLYSRLRRAAGKVCSEKVKKPLATQRESELCEEMAIERAVEEVGNKQLTTIHQS